jgi:hypothetical protein
MIFDDNPTIIHRHTTYHVEKDKLAHPKRQQNVKFGHQVVLNTQPKWHRHHPLIGILLARANNFFN